jgi:hypothetical protein
MRKVGGDVAADVFLGAIGNDARGLVDDGRRGAREAHRSVGVLARQAENTLDRATAMMPKLLYDRLDFVIVYPTAGLCFPRSERRHAPGGDRRQA